MATMLERYKKYWMRNFSKSVDGRAGWEACLRLANMFFVNIGIFFTWFASLIIVVSLAVSFGLLSNNNAAPVAILVFYILSFTHLIVFSYSRFGDRVISIVADYVEEAIRNALLGNPQILGSSFAAEIPEYSESILNRFPPVPCAPPRAHLA